MKLARCSTLSTPVTAVRWLPFMRPPPVRALRKFGQLAMRAHQQANRDDISSEIAESVQLVIQLQRYPDGRKVTEVIEVDGYDRDRKVFCYRTIFDRTHEDQDAIYSSPISSTHISHHRRPERCHCLRSPRATK